MPKKHSELLKVNRVCLNFFLLHTKMILFFYRMIQKISGLLKNFRIAMLPCYRGFSLSAHLNILHLLVTAQHPWTAISTCTSDPPVHYSTPQDSEKKPHLQTC